jgi:hypothetical protein
LAVAAWPVDFEGFAEAFVDGFGGVSVAFVCDAFDFMRSRKISRSRARQSVKVFSVFSF